MLLVRNLTLPEGQHSEYALASTWRLVVASIFLLKRNRRYIIIISKVTIKTYTFDVCGQWTPTLCSRAVLTYAIWRVFVTFTKSKETPTPKLSICKPYPYKHLLQVRSSPLTRSSPLSEDVVEPLAWDAVCGAWGRLLVGVWVKRPIEQASASRGFYFKKSSVCVCVLTVTLCTN